MYRNRFTKGIALQNEINLSGCTTDCGTLLFHWINLRIGTKTHILGTKNGEAFQNLCYAPFPDQDWPIQKANLNQHQIARRETALSILVSIMVATPPPSVLSERKEDRKEKEI